MTHPSQAALTCSLPDETTLKLHLAGCWRVGVEIPDVAQVAALLSRSPGVRRLVFDTNELIRWDSLAVLFVLQVMDLCREQAIDCIGRGLPPGIRRLLALVRRNQVADASGQPAAESVLVKLGRRTLQWVADTGELLGYVGEVCLSLFRFCTGRARYRRRDFWELIHECGVRALPIVSLISLLVGLILAFVGAVQLRMFGAQIYVADLVGIAMTREMGAIMTGVIMAGRTGAAFAAQLGSMRVNEEIDALATMGISTMDFLVGPRILALVLMMPLLCLYADLMGILGGFVVGVGVLDIPLLQYWEQTRQAVRPLEIYLGLGKSVCFALLVAAAGCLKGLQCGRSAGDVGRAATAAVVASIVAIIVADGIFAVLFDILGL